MQFAAMFIVVCLIAVGYRKKWLTILAMLWSSAHLPLIMGYTLAAGALSKMVVCTDVGGLDKHDLTHFYELKSEDHIPEGLRWFYCVGLANALANMGEFIGDLLLWS